MCVYIYFPLIGPRAEFHIKQYYFSESLNFLGSNVYY